LASLRKTEYVQSLKSKHNADFVYLFSHTEETARRRVCGLGFITNFNSSAYASQTLVSNYGCDPVGSKTFVHEVGHNLGLSHHFNDRQTSASGYGTWAFVTIMATPGKHGGYTRKSRLSNPDISCGFGYKCGDKNTADAITHINNWAPKRFNKVR